MIDWDSLNLDRIWPMWLGISVVIVLLALWYSQHRVHFPDIMLINNTVTNKGIVDRLPSILGSLILLLLIIVLMEPTVIRTVTVDQRARDFLVIFDTLALLECIRLWTRFLHHTWRVRKKALRLFRCG